MVFVKGNKDHLKRKIKYGKDHFRFGTKHSEETKRKIALTRTGQKRGEAFRQKMRLAMGKGPMHHSWKGGLTKKNHAIRTSSEYRLWRKAVFERDNYQCIWCGAKGKKVILHADHIKPFAFYPELRFAIDNGRVLCVSCHRTTFKQIWQK